MNAHVACVVPYNFTAPHSGALPTCLGSKHDCGRVCVVPQVVYEWAQGTPFADICGLTDVMEGSIVRSVVRLDQACRELLVRVEHGSNNT